MTERQPQSQPHGQQQQQQQQQQQAGGFVESRDREDSTNSDGVVDGYYQEDIRSTCKSSGPREQQQQQQQQNNWKEDAACPICLEDYTLPKTNTNNNKNIDLPPFTPPPPPNSTARAPPSSCPNECFDVDIIDDVDMDDVELGHPRSLVVSTAAGAVERVRLSTTSAILSTTDTVPPPPLSNIVESYNTPTTPTNAAAAMTLATPFGCEHAFCTACLREHCRLAIAARTVPILCPRHAGNPPCEGTVPDSVVRSLWVGRTRRYQQPEEHQHQPEQTDQSKCLEESGLLAVSQPQQQQSMQPHDDDDDEIDDDDDDGIVCDEFQSNNIQVELRDVDDAESSHNSSWLQPFGNSNTGLPPTTKHDGEQDMDDDEEDALRLGLWQKYNRLVQMSQDSNLVECPCCDSLVQSAKVSSAIETNNNNEDSNSSTNAIPTITIANDLECRGCGNSFCRIHGTVHVGVPCSTYMTTPAAMARQQDETLSETILSSWTKPCSRCGCRLQKAAGCDHVICPSCRQDMCWKCGTHIHLTGHVVRHCSQCQRDYRDHRYDHIYRCRLALCLPLLMPLFLAYTAILMVVATLTGCFCGCFQCGRCIVVAHKVPPPPPTTNTAVVPTIPLPLSPNSSSESLPQQLQPSMAPIPPTNPAPSTVAQPPQLVATNRTPGTVRHGLWATLVAIFLPVFALLEDFGFHLPIIDEIFPDNAIATEIPYLDLEMERTL